MSKSTQYPKWVHHPDGSQLSVVADDEDHEKKILDSWGVKTPTVKRDEEPAKKS